LRCALLMLGILHGPLRPSGCTYRIRCRRTYATKPAAAIRYWERHELRPPRIGVLENGAPAAPGTRWRSCLGRCRGGWFKGCHRGADVVTRKFATVITSPPYFGMQTYLPDQWSERGSSEDHRRPSIVRQINCHRGVSLSSSRLSRAVWRSTAAHCSPGSDFGGQIWHATIAFD